MSRLVTAHETAHDHADSQSPRGIATISPIDEASGSGGVSKFQGVPPNPGISREDGPDSPPQQGSRRGNFSEATAHESAHAASATAHDLRKRAQVALVGLLLISEGRVGALDSVNVHGGSRDYTPRGERSWHDHHTAQIASARTLTVLEETVKAAEEALRIARGGEARQRSSLPWEEFVVRRYEGWTPKQVADVENCERMQVWRARENRGRVGKDGTLKNAAKAA